MKFEIYKGANGWIYWRLKASNGKIVADSAEGYSSEENALHGINLVKSCLNAPIYRA